MTSQDLGILPVDVQALINNGYARHKEIANQAKIEKENKERADRKHVEEEWSIIIEAFHKRFPEALRPYISVDKEQRDHWNYNNLSADLDLDSCAPIWVMFSAKLNNSQCHIEIDKIIVAHLDEDEVKGWTYSTDWWHTYVFKLSGLDLALARSHREWPKIAKRQQNIADYGTAYKNYLEAREAAKTHNLALIEKIRQELEYQNMYAAADSAYELEYGITSHEDGETYTTTNTVWVLYNEPDENGRYTVIKRGELTKVNYFHKVSISNERLLPSSHLVTLQPKNAPKDSDYKIPLISVTRATEAYSIINKMYDAEYLPQPEEPNPVDFDLNEYSNLVRRIKEQACSEVYGEDYF